MGFKNGLAVFAVVAAAALVPAYGERAASVSGGQGAATAASSQNEITVVLSFARPRLITDANGTTDVLIDGLDNGGAVGAPLLPVRPTRIAIPQGMAVAGATVEPLSTAPLADGITVRHAERQYHYRPNAAYAPTPRDEAIYSLDTPYPAEAATDGATASKNGVSFYEMNVTPVFYIPKTGHLGYYPEIRVTIKLAARKALLGASSDSVPFVDRPSRRAAVAALVENPDVVAEYRGQALARRTLADDEGSGDASSGLSSTFEAPQLPCKAGDGYTHVVITGGGLTNAPLGLVKYRRGLGTTSTLVRVEDILAKYSRGGDRAATIRDFIRDAYATWGTEYVVLAGDTSIIPARSLFCQAGDETDELPSDMYYQCLDGDFDADGDGVYGETGDDVDFYAEVKVGRVSAETDAEFSNWLSKLKRYDADVAVGAEYTRGALFAAEYLGPYPRIVGTPLMEQIRLGTQYAGATGGFQTYGFADVPEYFDEERMPTLYDTDENEAWGASEIAMAIVANGGVSVINHMGHSNSSYNMRLTNEDVDTFVNENPFFVYSQGCIAGAFDEDCIAEHFTTSTKYGAFGGVWNSRYGWYSFSSSGVLPSGASHMYHRRFWNAVFQDGIHEIGHANMLSHELNATAAMSDGYMRWCLYETNLFGDPMQQICGTVGTVQLDREAYRSDATMTITYRSGILTNSFTALVSAYDPSDTVAAATAEVVLPYVGTADSRFIYQAQFDLSQLGVEHDWTITVSILDGDARAAEAYIDDVPPAFRNVSLANPDDGELSASWETYKPDRSDPDSGVYVDEDTSCEFYFDTEVPFSSPQVVTSGVYSARHSVTAPDLPHGLYYARILAADKAGNTNVWNSAAATAEVSSQDETEYGVVALTPRAAAASWDMERDASGWTTDDPGCWQLGVPTYGPENASRCWGTVLDGRHPDGANASLVSPEISLQSAPTIVFRHWHAIGVTPPGGSNLAGADYGVVEVMATSEDASVGADGAWVNVTPYAKDYPGGFVQGFSNVWRTVRIALPEEFANRKVRVRFRFVSDTYPNNVYPSDYPAANTGNPAGWYIDNVRLLDVPDRSGAILEAVPTGDAASVVLKAGETTEIGLRTFNLSYSAITAASGGTTLALSASGVPSGSVTIDGAATASPAYGTIPACSYGDAEGTFAISVGPSVPAGTPVTLTQTLRTSNGGTLLSSLTLRVVEPAGIAGTVVQPAFDGLPEPNPVCGATVTVNASDSDYSMVTGPDGAYSFEGFSSNRILRVSASYGLAEATAVAKSPAYALDITLPLSEFNLSTNAVSLVCKSDVDELAVDTIVISNFFNKAALDGNQGPSAPLEYTVTGHLDDDGSALPWLTLSNPKGEVAPGGSVTLDIVLFPSAASASDVNSATLAIESSGWNVGSTNVTITLSVDEDVILEPAGISATETDGDGDGMLEPGESGTLAFLLHNTSRGVKADNFDGTIEVTSGDATLSSDIVSWTDIWPGATAACDPGLEVVMGTSDVVEFSVSGYVFHGAFSNRLDLAFAWTNTAFNVMDGIVQAENLHPADPVGEVNPVEAARVSATGADGATLYSNYTGTNGVYSISGLVAGEKYWISVSAPLGSGFVPPQSTCITAEDADFSADLTGTTYGTVAGHLSLSSMTFSDSQDDLSDATLYANGDGHIGNGETFRIAPTFVNDGHSSVRGLRAKLSLPAEFERDSCMEIVSGSDEIETGTNTVVASGGYIDLSNYGFLEATVASDAVAGDMQRFLLEVWEDVESVEPKRWYFDFAVTVNPRYTISGSVLDEDGAPVDGATIGVAASGTSSTNLVQVSAETGEWALGSRLPGDYSVFVASLPDGFVAEPDAIAVTVADADVSGIDFTVKPWGMGADGDGYDPDTGAISLTVTEGQTGTASFSISADAASDGDNVDVSILYDRKASEALTRADLEVATADARAALAAAVGADWRNLDGTRFSATDFEFLFTGDSTDAERDAYLARRGFAVKYRFKTIPAIIATPAEGMATLASSILANAPANFSAGDDAAILVSAQPSAKVFSIQSSAYVPDDEFYEEQWALSNDRQTGGTKDIDIGAESAWEFAQTTGSRDVLVAITDTGIEYTHPDLRANWSGRGWNYALNSASVRDQHGHGTHVAGIVGAVGGNGIGVVGVNWKVSLMSQRICALDWMGQEVWASSAEIARSFEDAYLAGVKVNNNSWGTPFYSDVMLQAMKKAQDYGMLFVCAAGNEAYDLGVQPSYPASYAQYLDNIVVVAATDHDGGIAEFSNYSPKQAHIAAPGVDILSTAISSANGSAAAGAGAMAGSGNYVIMSGTSMAAPFVTGAAAFLNAVVPDASPAFIRNALLNGVRRDPLLEEYVSTSGHLDLATAVRLLGAQWLRFGDDSSDPVALKTNVTVAAGGSVALPLLVNDPAMLKAGTYEARISITGRSSAEVPVTLKVLPAAIAAVSSVEIAEEEAADGLCSHGETVTLAISLRNAGSLEFEGLAATLGGASGGSILSDSFDYGYISGGDTSMPGLFKVVLPDSGEEATYTLTLTEDGEEVAVLPVSIALAESTVIAVSVVDVDGAPVSGAEVEIIGAGAGRAVTGDDGIAYVASSVASGECTLRVFADGFAPASQAIDASAGSASVGLGHATLSSDSDALAFHVAEGVALATNAVVSASSASGPIAAKVVVANRAKVAVFDDRDDSGVLVSRLRQLGFDVDYFPSNYIYTVYSYGPSEYAEIVSAPRYTWNDAALLPYDAVVTTISGANGTGRLLAPLEQAAFESFIERGGIAVFSGATPLSSPDNVELAALAGLSEDACSVVDIRSNAALAAEDGLGAPFVALSAGDAFPAASGSHDSSTNGTFVSGVCLATAGNADSVSKIYASERTQLGGRAYLWNGNASDWAHDGAALDILTATLFDELVADNPPDWIQPVASEISVEDGGEVEIPLVLNSRRNLGTGTHEATVLLVADVDGARSVPLNVSLTVDPPAIRAYTTGSVTDAAGRALAGDGGEGSCLLQLLWAGPDGIPDSPESDGSAGGDDVILAASDTLLPYARFGQGALPGSGAFDVEFGLAADGIEEGDAGIALFVRAWDAPSIATAVAYGDSGASNVVWTAGLPEAIDFGSWGVTNVFADASYDGNGDGIPDAWAAIYRPDIDSHASPAALETGATIGEDDLFDTTYHREGNPVRVFASGNFVFVLEQRSHRIAVHDRASGTNLFYYGATVKDGPASLHNDAEAAHPSAAEGAFNMPYGMALDTLSGANRFAVADTGNNRVQIFEFDPDSGEISFVAAFGSKSPTPGIEAPAGTFTSPMAVAFIKGSNDGDLLVADSGNYRVARLNVSGSTLTWRRTYNFTEQDYITGLCYARHGREGFWVANGGKTRQRVSYHYTSDFNPDAPQASLGGITSTGASNGEFNIPRDIQLWTVGDTARLAVTDYNGSRLRVLSPVLDDSGAVTGLLAVADIGDYSDKTLDDYERLWHPVGVFPVDGTNQIYVADTGHNQIKWFGLALDADGDGMDDFWEDQNGLDSSIDDSQDDADGDGLPNIGEFRAGTDPQNEDTDGDGHRDLWEMENLTDPLDPESSPDETEPEPPEEEYETVGWTIDSIAVDSSGAPKVTIGWTLPTDNLPAAGDDLTFSLGVKFSLTDGSDWDETLVEVPAQPQGGGAATLEIDVSQNPFASASSAFFTLYWTNKAKE